MNEVGRPNFVSLLIIVFAYLFIRSTTSTLVLTHDPNYQLFKQNRASFLYLLLSMLIILITGAALYYLWKPKPIGLWIAILSIVLRVVNPLLNFLIAIINPESLQQAYLIAREASGTPIGPDFATRLYTSTGFFITTGLTIVLDGLIIALLLRNKAYFLQADQKEL
jgi:hypothetical protein